MSFLAGKTTEFAWPAVSEIAGREQEFLVSSSGRRISLTAVNMHSDIFDGLYAVQFYQDEPGVAEFRYVPGPQFHASHLSTIESAILQKLGDDFRLVLRAVEETEEDAARQAPLAGEPTDRIVGPGIGPRPGRARTMTRHAVGSGPRSDGAPRGRGVLAAMLVGAVYALAVSFSRLRGRRRGPDRAPRRVAVVGTFYNTNWFLSHAVPLTRAGIDELVVVTDEPQAALPGVRFVCPSRWAVAAFGRTMAKLACLMLAGLRYRPALYMGYHVIPGGVVALLTARTFGRPAVYQMTGGPLEVAGGGFGSENPVLARLGRPHPRLERLALCLVREFDQVIVRGPGARAFLVERGVSARAVAIIPGSVDPTSLVTQPERTLDLVFVGRLVDLKQPLQFVEILAAVAEQRPSVQGLMVGGGPLLGAVRERAVALGVAGRLKLAGKSDDVPQILGRSRVFVLTSRSEGLSIAMAEAMMAGVVPVVADVGELAELVCDGVNGYLVTPNDIAAFARHIVSLLERPLLWSRLSAAAAAAARAHVGLDHVSGLWRAQLDLIGHG